MSTMNRRAMLAGAAAVPLASIPAIASEPDPIFGLIADHRAIVLTFDALSHDDDALNDAVRISNHAYVKLLTTPPTTLAGWAALLRHVEKQETEDNGAAPFFNGCGGELEPLVAVGETFLSRVADVLDAAAKRGA